MKVVYLTPTYFDNASLIGGGERYANELAACMATQVDTTLVSFAAERQSQRWGNLKLELYPVKHFLQNNRLNPFSLRYLNAIIQADVVHIHQVNTLVSDLACFVAGILRKPAFVSDLGGGAGLVLNRKLPIFWAYKHAIAISKYAIDWLPPKLKPKAVLVKGGIDNNRFCPDPNLAKENKILCVARILPHKGTNYLIEGFKLLNRRDYTLKIVGRVYNQDFYDYLKQLAEGWPVEFVHDADDQQILHEYRTARVNVLPSVHTDYYGTYTPVPELMGFTLLEAQACGTPVICTEAGAMSEFVDPGRTGWVVKQNSGEAIAAALRQVVDMSASDYAQFQVRCQEWILPLSWSMVVQQLLKIYQQALD